MWRPKARPKSVENPGSTSLKFKETVTQLYQQFECEMRKHALDTAVVIGESTLGNPELAYVTGTLIPRGGIFLKRASHDPFLVVANIDAASARRGRVKDIRTYSDYGYERLLKRYGRERGQIMLLDRLLRSVRARDRVAIYGRSEFSHTLALADSLRKMGHKIVGEQNDSLIESLRETKESAEIEKIRSVGAKSARVVESILEMLRECQITAGKLRWKNQLLKIGAVKSMINLILAQHDLMAPEGTIFAVGRSSADPHEEGAASDPIRQNVPIVLDLFPTSVEGYWFDLTRTFVIGKAPSKIKKMFETVLEAQLRSLDMMREDVSGREVMNSACDYFERRGFTTIRGILKGDKEAAKTGFIHSLGHGVGLTIGEKPSLSLFSDDTLKRGHVVTVEPGLYIPHQGGVRIEDTVLVKGRRIDNLTPLSKELEL